MGSRLCKSIRAAEVFIIQNIVHVFQELCCGKGSSEPTYHKIAYSFFCACLYSFIKHFSVAYRAKLCDRPRISDQTALKELPDRFCWLILVQQEGNYWRVFATTELADPETLKAEKSTNVILLSSISGYKGCTVIL